MLNIDAFLAGVTQHPGVYQMLGNKGQVLYVGKARNLKKRLSSYFKANQKDNKTLALLQHITDITITVTHSENEALLLECNLIKKYKPHYNILFRDDKSYPYIVITSEHPYPRIDLYRGQRKKEDRYFGPYPNVAAVRETIHLIQKLFGLRTCSDHFYASRTRPCLHHQIGLCSGSCAGLISPEEYQQQVHYAILFLQGKNKDIISALQKKMEKLSDALQFELAATLRDQVARLRQMEESQCVSSGSGSADVLGVVIRGGTACIQLFTIRHGRMLGSRAYFPVNTGAFSEEDVLASFMAQHYFSPKKNSEDIPKEIILNVELSEKKWLESALGERAKHKVCLLHRVRNERKKWLAMAVLSAGESIATQLFNKTNMQERFFALQHFLQLKNSPTRVECFDISHTMGEETVGSCVVFNVAGPMKSSYRRFKIENITPGNDIAAMEQVLHRRYQHLQKENAALPDIIFIDGGRQQLSVAKKVMDQLQIFSVILMGVSKGAGRKPGLETLHFIDRPALSLPSDSLALHLIQQIRDEAHRFALTGHRQRRDKKRRTSVLESISGIGALRRRELLRHFGGIQALARASLEDISKVSGINQSLAERIFVALHE